ncbi:MAG: hypothetical protein U0271_44980 [Polyangiaceae bacterium]
MPLTDPRVSATFAALLAREREALNARFVRGGALLGRSSRAEGARVDPEVMLAFLERTAQPIVDAAPVDARRALLFELFDLVLAGVSLKLVGERDTPSAFERGLVGAWPALGAHASPTLLRALGNAFEKLTRELGEAAATRWLEELAKVAHLATERATLQEAGFLLAWRAGSRGRGRVPERAPAASPALLSAIFGVEALDRDPARRFVAPSHRGPLGPLEVVARLGGSPVLGVFDGPRGPRRRRARVLATDGSACSSCTRTPRQRARASMPATRTRAPRRRRASS